MCQNYVMQSLSGLIHFGFLRSSPYASLSYSLSNVLQSLKYSHLTISLTFSKDKACFQSFHILLSFKWCKPVVLWPTFYVTNEIYFPCIHVCIFFFDTLNLCIFQSVDNITTGFHITCWCSLSCWCWCHIDLTCSWVNTWARWHSSRQGATDVRISSSLPIIWTISWSHSIPIALKAIATGMS